MKSKHSVAMTVCSVILHLASASAQAQLNRENQATTTIAPAIAQHADSEHRAHRKDIIELHLGRINAGGDVLVFDYANENGGLMGVAFQITKDQSKHCCEWLARFGVVVEGSSAA